MGNGTLQRRIGTRCAGASPGGTNMFFQNRTRDFPLGSSKTAMRAGFPAGTVLVGMFRTRRMRTRFTFSMKI